MEEIVVFLFDIDVIERSKLTKMSFKELNELAEKHCDVSQKYSLLGFQEAFNDEMIDDIHNWIVFAKKD